MSRLMIIGCGGVASVAIHKCCQNSDVFTEIMIASRTVSKCDALKEKLQGTTKTKITTAKVDADNVDELVALMESYKPDAVLNVALPVSGPDDHGRMLKGWRELYRYRKLRAGGHRRSDSGARSMRNAARKRASPHTSIIPGSGHIRRNSKRLDLWHFLGTGFDPGVTSVFYRVCVKALFR